MPGRPRNPEAPFRMTLDEEQVLVLMRESKLNYKQIADLMGRNPKAIQCLANRAVQKEQAEAWGEMMKTKKGGETSLRVARGDKRMKGTK